MIHQCVCSLDVECGEECACGRPDSCNRTARDRAEWAWWYQRGYVR